MTSQDPPLDEIQWRSPIAAQQMQGIHSNSVLFYFAQSPFYDPTSNNAIVMSQAMYNPNMLHLVQTREAFEGRLKTMSGLEFMVAQEPAEMAPGTGTGVWVIRKQTRRKRQAEEDEVVVHSTYFVVGENIYMAPAVGDVLGSRLLSVLNSLNKFISTAASLPSFSPATGHTYFPTTNSRKGVSDSASQLDQASKEPTPLPDSLQPSRSALTTSNRNTDISTYLSGKLFEESLIITQRYGDEYMDENPITGQPGEFHFTSTGRKEKLQLPSIVKGPLHVPAPNVPKPPPLRTDIEPDKKNQATKSPKTPGGSRVKRRKSKVATSPA